MSGKPDAAGRFDVVVGVSLEREHRTLDPAQLQWGVEKTLATRTENVGTTQQSFAIEIAP
jgi:hypothetical protein